MTSRHTLAGWLWYAKQMPGQLGWPVVLLAALALRALANRLPDALATLAWVALPTAVVAQTALARPVDYVDGYAEAASYVATHAPRDSRVLFSGYRDGSFTFAMRTHEERRDLGVVRADKLLLSVSVRRELGVTEKAVSDAQLLAQVEQLGIRYVVIQPGFWTDLPAMLQSLRRCGVARGRIPRATPTSHGVQGLPPLLRPVFLANWPQAKPSNGPHENAARVPPRGAWSPLGGSGQAAARPMVGAAAGLPAARLRLARRHALSGSSI